MAKHLLTMPSLAPGARSSKIVAWVKQEGDRISVGDVLFEAEMDKATVEVTAEHPGTIRRLLAPAGTEIVVGAAIAEMEGEHLDDEGEAETSSTVTVEAQPTPPPSVPSAEFGFSRIIVPDAARTRVFASPAARRLARERRLDLGRITGTGPGGRIVAADVIGHAETLEVEPAAAASSAAPSIDVAQAPRPTSDHVKSAETSGRGAQARTLRLATECDLGAMNRLCRQMAAEPSVTTELDTLDFLVRAAAVATRRVPLDPPSRASRPGLEPGSSPISVRAITATGRIVATVHDAATRPLSLIARDLRGSTAEPHGEPASGLLIRDYRAAGVWDASSSRPGSNVAVLAIGQVATGATTLDEQRNDEDVLAVCLAADAATISDFEVIDWLREFRSLVENPLSIIV